MSLASVEVAARRASEASEALRREVLSTVDDGVPIAAVARVTGIARSTLHRWLREEAGK